MMLCRGCSMRIKIPYWPLLLGPSLAVGLGMLMNAVVIAANHHTMPVLVTSCEQSSVGWAMSGDNVHACMDQLSRFKFLADWFYIPGLGTASPGDFFEWASELAWYPSLAIWASLMIRDRNKK